MGCVVLGGSVGWVGWRRVVVGVWVYRREIVLLLGVFACRRLLLLYASSDQDGLNEQGLAHARKIQPQVHNLGGAQICLATVGRPTR